MSVKFIRLNRRRYVRKKRSVDVIEKAGIWRVWDGHLITYGRIIGFLIKMGTRFCPLKLLLVILCLTHISFIVIFDVGMSTLINEIFVPFKAQQTLQLPISFSQLQEEFVLGASVNYFLSEEFMPFLKGSA